jgi:hypothetical protein
VVVRIIQKFNEHFKIKIEDEIIIYLMKKRMNQPEDDVNDLMEHELGNNLLQSLLFFGISG